MKQIKDPFSKKCPNHTIFKIEYIYYERTPLQTICSLQGGKDRGHTCVCDFMSETSLRLELNHELYVVF
jgi:hypothetical protein